MDAVAVVAVGACLALYVCVGMAGYATFGRDVSSDLLENYPGSEEAVVVSRLGFSALVSFSYPLMCKPARDSFLSLVEHGALPGAAARLERPRIRIGIRLYRIGTAQCGTHGIHAGTVTKLTLK